MPLFNPLTTHHLPLTIFLAYIIDLALGDPKWFPHPVRWIGGYIVFLEDKIRRFMKIPLYPPFSKGEIRYSPLYQRGDGGILEKIGGIFLFIIVVGTVFGFSWVLLYFTFHLSPFTFYLLSVFLAYTTLSIKSLHQEARSVIHALIPPFPPLLKGGDGGVAEARKRLSHIVGRDTQNLSEEEIYRAVVETVAENTSDGIVAPLFYLALGGPALALAYKAVNTLDSMVGYKNERYKNFGWFSARMDDIANFIPARITAVLMVIACFILRLDWKNSLKIIRRDSRNHPSPNAGYPEAAAAGALGLQLGGVNYYFGAPHHRPLIGDKDNSFTMESVRNTVRIMRLTAFMGVVLFSGLLIIFL
ncbi:MAG: cobalamin biosynthesis protein CobD [Deltaproteobacteria bacterium]|nr:cobalamin biosynthesis protein CobD [Deltaproteobacteria bacterium]